MVCDKEVCDKVVCDREAVAEEDEEEREEERDTESKTRTPHKDVGKKRFGTFGAGRLIYTDILYMYHESGT